MDIEKTVAGMTLPEKVGQLFLLAFSGSRLDEARVLMEQHLVGAAYISNDNVPTPAAAHRLTRELQSYAAGTRLQIPLLLGVDQEGAWGVMVPESCTGPGNMALGAAGDPAFAYNMYRVIGTELAAVGLNTLLAPCADCNSNPLNSIIGMRSFGERAARVGALTAAAVRGAHDGGVVTTVKHFPGHGDTTLDSHRGLPTVQRPKEELYTLDLHPFAEAIKAGVDIVMTAHIIFTALDPDHPATLSPAILRGVLREDLGFDGVILSDSMNMGAMKRHYDPQQSVVEALLAGVDLVMLAEEHYDHDATTYLQQQIALLEAVTEAVNRGVLPLARVDDAVTRVLRLKQRLGTAAERAADPDTALSVVGSDSHRAVELDAARGAVAVLCDQYGVLPLAPGQPIVLVNTTRRSAYAPLGQTRGIGPNQTEAAFDLFAAELRRRWSGLRVVSAEEVLNGSADRRLDAPAAIVAVTENFPLPGMDFDQSNQRPVIEYLLGLAPQHLIVVALRDPYELRSLPPVPAYLCAFSFRPCAAAAAAQALCGEIVPAGHSPVSVPEAGIQA